QFQKWCEMHRVSSVILNSEERRRVAKCAPSYPAARKYKRTSSHPPRKPKRTFEEKRFNSSENINISSVPSKGEGIERWSNDMLRERIMRNIYSRV
ncbi:hypothetical protein PFISCL1PPCAC_27297, partial [Pristionchus fissidentatus]